MDIERRTNWNAPVGTGPSLAHAVVSNPPAKPVVRCDRPDYPPEVGFCTYIHNVIGHPRLGSLPCVRTSTVVSILDNGFETLNTVYEYLSDTKDDSDEL